MPSAFLRLVILRPFPLEIVAGEWNSLHVGLFDEWWKPAPPTVVPPALVVSLLETDFRPQQVDQDAERDLPYRIENGANAEHIGQGAGHSVPLLPSHVFALRFRVVPAADAAIETAFPGATFRLQVQLDYRNANSNFCAFGASGTSSDCIIVTSAASRIVSLVDRRCARHVALPASEGVPSFELRSRSASAAGIQTELLVASIPVGGRLSADGSARLNALAVAFYCSRNMFSGSPRDQAAGSSH
jgi:hypothetical protein